MSLKSWAKKEFLTSAVLVPAGFTLLFLGYVVTYRLPDLEKRIDRFSEDQARLVAEQERRTEKWESEQRDRLNAMDVQLVGIRTNLLRLCAQGGNPDRRCQTRELVSAASEIVKVQSRQLASASVQQSSGKTPKVDSGTESLLSEIRAFPTASQISGPSQIAAVATWATAADDARWFVRNGSLQVSYANGSAAFAPAVGVTEQTLEMTAHNLNTLSETFRSARTTDKLAPRNDVSPAPSTTVLRPIGD